MAAKGQKKIRVKLNVNGKNYKVEVKPHWTLLQVIRDQLGLTGTKYGCGTGECGACTVLIDGKPMTSCLVLAASAEGRKIVTIEGISSEGKLHPLQEAFIEEGAIQCGYCTPGMILAAKAFLERNPNPTEEEVRRAIDGNLCRCTGYVKIVKAILKASKKLKK
ncbi:MAG: (2Fe-2S)-binding protein [Candidatus Hadarchaeum sp.]|uniref:(2Fe-2S)-binding protein n=1 Tax=Candidatus Hadarchaeum sp. TaxID=2883567 RepID=UPI003D145296